MRQVDSSTPVFVTMVMATGAPSLRTGEDRDVICGALAAAGPSFQGFRVLQVGGRGDGLGLICSADSEEDFTRGIEHVAALLTEQLNEAWGRRGKVFGDDYQVEVDPVLA